MTLSAEDAVRLGRWWTQMQVEPEDAARMAFGGLDAASARLVLRAYTADWNDAWLGREHRAA